MAEETNAAPAALVTGASAGIGLATCRMLLERGYRVGMVGRSPERLESAAEVLRAQGADASRIVPLAGDVGDPEQASAVVDHCLASFGRVDALINNAGAAPLVPIAETDIGLLRDTFAVNAFGPMLLVAKLWPTFIEQGSACVVNVSSASTADPFPGFLAYGGAKSALESLTRSIVNERGTAKIRAFSVAPGAVETAMLRGLFTEDQVPTTAALSPDDVAHVIVDCVLGRRDDEDGARIALRAG